MVEKHSPINPTDAHETSFINGVESVQLFEADKQAELIQKLEDWYEVNKDSIPVGGIAIDANRTTGVDGSTPVLQEQTGLSGQLSGLTIPKEAQELFHAVLADSADDPEIGSKDVRFIIERTGGATHGEDNKFHVDTKRIYWDENGDRIDYDPARSLTKYMVYIGRPGTIIIHGKLDSSLTHHEGVIQANQYSLDSEGKVLSEEGAPEPVVSQLLPNQIYKVAVGELMHSPPLHDDGLLITALFNG